MIHFPTPTFFGIVIIDCSQLYWHLNQNDLISSDWRLKNLAYYLQNCFMYRSSLQSVLTPFANCQKMFLFDFAFDWCSLCKLSTCNICQFFSNVRFWFMKPSYKSIQLDSNQYFSTIQIVRNKSKKCSWIDRKRKLIGSLSEVMI